MGSRSKEETMGIGDWLCSDVFGGTGRLVKTFAALSLVLTLTAATSRAGDISAQPANGLSITNSANDVLPQVGGGAPGAAPPVAGPGAVPGGETGGLSGLHISGYGSQTFGMWQNPTNLKAYTRSRNNLAVARLLLQVDENYRL